MYETLSLTEANPAAVSGSPATVASGSRLEFFPGGTAMEMQETKWRIAAAICIAIIYVFITTLSGGA